MDKETSEIAKLTGRISKDPKSKLFVPLAEEYKKAGDIGMAIHVLLEGLKSNPDYVIARSSLGKLLIAKGDLAGAQKEFEEVVKASPDNLMAQKKLGDLLIIQNRPQDALQHYKIARSLSPDDEELASLISDVEAGRDVKSSIQGGKVKTTPRQSEKQAPPVSGTASEPEPEPAVSRTSDSEQAVSTETSSEYRAGSPATDEATKQVSVFSVTDTEEPEEVLIVEPLEPELPSQELPSTGTVLPGELDQPETPVVAGDESVTFGFPLDSKLPDEPVASQDIQQEQELFKFKGEDQGAIQEDVAEATIFDEVTGTEFSEERSEQVPETPFEVAPGADDFTTDTLAELYISQGFFEKAIEIYERMLVDRPDSRGLQDKLAWVRAEAARTGTPPSDQKEQQEDENILAAPEAPGATEYEPVAESGEVVPEPQEEQWPFQQDDSADIKSEEVTQTGEYVPADEPEEILLEAEVITEPGESGPGIEQTEEKTLAESRESQSAEQNEQISTGGEAGFTVSAAVPVEAPLQRDFEPREYVPPNREPERPKPAPHQERSTPILSNAGRRDAIARLETWLTTIKKEK